MKLDVLSTAATAEPTRGDRVTRTADRSGRGDRSGSDDQDAFGATLAREVRAGSRNSRRDSRPGSENAGRTPLGRTQSRASDAAETWQAESGPVPEAAVDMVTVPSIGATSATPAAGPAGDATTTALAACAAGAVAVAGGAVDPSRTGVVTTTATAVSSAVQRKGAAEPVGATTAGAPAATGTVTAGAAPGTGTTPTAGTSPAATPTPATATVPVSDTGGPTSASTMPAGTTPSGTTPDGATATGSNGAGGDPGQHSGSGQPGTAPAFATGPAVATAPTPTPTPLTVPVVPPTGPAGPTAEAVTPAGVEIGGTSATSGVPLDPASAAMAGAASVGVSTVPTVHSLHAPPPAPAAPPAPVPLPTPAQQIAPHLVSLGTGVDGTHRMTLQLHPEDLGSLRISVELLGQTVNVSLMGDNDAARDLLRDALPDLRRELASAGLDTGTLDVSTRQPGSGPAGHGTGAEAEANSHRTSGGAPRSAREGTVPRTFSRSGSNHPSGTIDVTV